MTELNKLLENFRKWAEGLKPFSWETLIFLSLLSWLVSLAVANPVVSGILARIGWLFLTGGVAWAMEKTKLELFGLKLYPGPWVAGALFCGFLFLDLEGQLPTYLTVWPLVSAAIAILPKFIKHGTAVVNPIVDDPKKYASDRQEIIFVVLFGILLSCWFQFYFLLQNWLIRYPSLRGDDFSRSGFVTRVGSGVRPSSTGVTILNVMEATLREELTGASWVAVQQWLIRLEDNLSELRERVFSQLPPDRQSERSLWQLNAAVLDGEPPYTVRFQAEWTGPGSRPQGYYAEQICRISEAPIAAIEGSPTPENQLTSRIECLPVRDRI